MLDAWTRATATRGPAAACAPPCWPRTSRRPTPRCDCSSPAEPAARTTIALLDVIDAAWSTGGPAARCDWHRRPGDGRRSCTLAVTARRPRLLRAARPCRSPGSRRARPPTDTPPPIGLRAPPAPVGDTLRVLTLVGQGRTALRLDVAFEGAGVELRASAMRADAGGFAPATAAISRAELSSGRGDPRRRWTRAAVRWRSRSTGNRWPTGGSRPRSAGRGAGDAARPRPAGRCAGQPRRPWSCATCICTARPVGPPDPRLRLAAAPASAWSPGDPFVLARSADGVTTVGDGVAASVVGVQGDRSCSTGPSRRPSPAAGSIAYRRSEFFSQRTLRRSDDLMNQLYRICAEYRVSTVLDELDGGVTAPLAEIVDTQVRDFARLAAELAAPGEPRSRCSSAADRPRVLPAPRPCSRPTRLNPRQQHPKHHRSTSRLDGGVPWLNA